MKRAFGFVPGKPGSPPKTLWQRFCRGCGANVGKPIT